MLKCTGTYVVTDGEVDFGSSSSAVIVVIVVLLVLLVGGAVGAFLFVKSKKQPIGVAQNANIVPPSVVTAPPTQPTLAPQPAPAPQPVLAPQPAPASSAPPMPIASAPQQSVDSLASLAIASEVTKADLATYDLDDIREMMKDERTCPGGVTVPVRKKIEVSSKLNVVQAIDLQFLDDTMDVVLRVVLCRQNGKRCKMALPLTLTNCARN